MLRRPLVASRETGRLPHQQFPLFPPFCFPSCFFKCPPATQHRLVFMRFLFFLFDDIVSQKISFLRVISISSQHHKSPSRKMLRPWFLLGQKFGTPGGFIFIREALFLFCQTYLFPIQYGEGVYFIRPPKLDLPLGGGIFILGGHFICRRVSV